MKEHTFDTDTDAATPTGAIKVRRGVDPNYLQTVLTKDITPLESLYDLVDNAIDGARDRILAKGPVKLDNYGLPASYAGYRVAIRFSQDLIALLDNCSGIDEATLTGRAFITGSISSHRFGIGRFGIGLKRALFRLGRTYALTTDTGSFAARMRFGFSELGSSDEDGLVARRVASTGAPRTFLCITGLGDGVRHEFEAPSWVSTVVKSLSRRYGLYIEKGFSISVNGRKVPGFGPKLRQSGPVTSEASNTVTSEGVRVFIDAGMHEGYRLTQEDDYDRVKVLDLTDQYGWYFVCNDRIIKVASHESDLGWASNWHQEYYGFVGWVRFVAEDAENLPWDTKKTSIDPNSSVFLQIVGRLQSYAENYKAENIKARKAQIDGAGGKYKEKGKDADKAKSGGGDTKGKGGRRGARAGDHNDNWNKLLPETEVVLRSPKVMALVYEATQLPVERCYAGSMLLRSIVELALAEHIKGAGKYAEVRQRHFDEQEQAGRPFTDAQKATFRPTFQHMLQWLNQNDEYFPPEVRRECISARGKFGRHLKELNGVVHEGDLTDSGKLKIVRNDTWPLLRFLLTTPPRTDFGKSG